jgi:hypothetical protein
MTEPVQIAVSVRIVEAARYAMADAMETHSSVAWDVPLLAYEIARMLGSLMRSAGMPPEDFDGVLLFAREVYAGIETGRFLTVDDAVAQYCRAAPPEPLETSDGAAGLGGVVH